MFVSPPMPRMAGDGEHWTAEEVAEIRERAVERAESAKECVD
jgi:hypothetical protein